MHFDKYRNFISRPWAFIKKNGISRCCHSLALSHAKWMHSRQQQLGQVLVVVVRWWWSREESKPPWSAAGMACGNIKISRGMLNGRLVVVYFRYMTWHEKIQYHSASTSISNDLSMYKMWANFTRPGGRQAAGSFNAKCQKHRTSCLISIEVDIHQKLAKSRFT